MEAFEVTDVRLNDEIFVANINGKAFLIQQLIHCNNDQVIMDEIGKFRYSVWSDEVNGNVHIGSEYGEGIMLDALDFDASCRNFVVREYNGDDSQNQIIAAARMTLHSSWEDKSSRDLLIFETLNPTLPIVDLGRLVVSGSHRKQGIAQFLNELRVHLSKLLGANTVIATASESNSRLFIYPLSLAYFSLHNLFRLLLKLKFSLLNKIVYFDDRPTVPFHCLLLNLRSGVDKPCAGRERDFQRVDL